MARIVGQMVNGWTEFIHSSGLSLSDDLFFFVCVAIFEFGKGLNAGWCNGTILLRPLLYGW